MSLPPEHIRIKRRREEEPVETLYIQSQTHQPKRRFTDFCFQRVVRRPDKGVSPKTDLGIIQGASPRENIKGPRSASTSNISHGVPAVRATAPGSELKTRQIMSKKEGSLGKNLLPPLSPAPSVLRASPATKPSVSPVKNRSGSSSVISSPSSALRRFHITAPSGDFASPSQKLLHKVSGGVLKNRGDRIKSRAVVIEKRSHQIDDARASIVLDDLASKIEEVKVSGDHRETQFTAPKNITKPTVASEKSTISVNIRKRPVVNDAEKRWREESKASRYLDRAQQARDKDQKAKSAQSIHEDPSLWDHNSDQLATELAELARELTNATEMPEVSPKPAPQTPPRKPGQFVGISPNKPVLRYPPRVPKLTGDSPGTSGTRFDGAGDDGDTANAKDGRLSADSSRLGQPHQHDEANVNRQNFIPPAKKQIATFETASDHDSDDDSDDSYVYDEFIRRPIEDITAGPHTAHLLNGEWVSENGGAPRDIGVVVITEEDLHFWESFAESDEEGKGWDSEDEDSNAEDNPANEYPDEELEFDDQFDDTNTAYRNYRLNASDDEEFDADYDKYEYGCGASNGAYSDDDY
ncbi:conserved hypothetical protein [Histoplasma capsulatum var. duboisii H88]|uniref:Transcription factor Iwr1 domain-containing protein n=1 Tax=Ajellomyces capsulatus (strain H88) TaxID=544711 RepID=F0UNB5_AJEC8|nr:conserved hypothetical protein [Histoplasma capsulatum var. duboisii H88]QSS53742.1 hypothetical protein I7I53_01098 [Histoplasma capsulatum var. duboisii H88]